MRHILISDILLSIALRWKVLITIVLLFVVIAFAYIIFSKPVYELTSLVKANVFELYPRWPSQSAYERLVPTTPIDRMGTQLEVVKVLAMNVLKDKGVNLEFKLPKGLIVEDKKTNIGIMGNMTFELEINGDSINVFKNNKLLCSGTIEKTVDCQYFSFKLKKNTNFSQLKGKIIYKNFKKVIDDWMKKKVFISQEGLTDIIKISVEHHDPYLASKIADEIAKSYVDYSLEQEKKFAKISVSQLESLLNEFNKKIDSLKQLAKIVRMDSITMVSYMLEFRKGLANEALARIFEKLILNPDDPYLRRTIGEYFRRDIDFNSLNREIVSYLDQRDSILMAINQSKIAEAKTLTSAYILSLSSLPYKPKWPRKDIISALSLWIGILFGIIVSLIYDGLDRRIVSPIQLKRWTNIENVLFFNSLKDFEIYYLSNPNKKFHFNINVEKFRNYPKDEADEIVLIVKRGISIYDYLNMISAFQDKKLHIILV